MDSNFDQLVGGGRTVKWYISLCSFEELDFILAYSSSILDQFDLSVECYFFSPDKGEWILKIISNSP